MSNIPIADAEAVTCPNCGSPPGSVCRDEAGGTRAISHGSRRTLALSEGHYY